jgi:hypothetical protein
MEIIIFNENLFYFEENLSKGLMVFSMFTNLFFELYNRFDILDKYCRIISTFFDKLPNKILFSVLKVITLYNKDFYNEFLRYDLFYLNLSFSQKETLLKLSLL